MRSFGRILVLPDLKDKPTGLGELLVVAVIPFNIAQELCSPILLVGPARVSPMARAPVPKAPVHEDRDPCGAEDNVRSDATSIHRLNGAINAETKARRM